MNEPLNAPGARPDPDRLMSFAEGCEFLHMSPRWVGERVKDKTLPHLRCGRNIRFRRSALISWCEEQERGGKST
jgi:excisionase family DNA binding protein